MTPNAPMRGGISRGGVPEEPHGDGLPGLTYRDDFRSRSLGRSGLDLVNTSFDRRHVDVIERDPLTGQHFHHRITQTDL